MVNKKALLQQINEIEDQAVLSKIASLVEQATHGINELELLA